MGGAEPQAAALRAAEDDALEALRLDWGEHYLTGYTPGMGWWAARHGGGGQVIWAENPDELREEMTRAAATIFEQQALEVLRDAWGVYYQIGCDEERGWWASRHGCIGHRLTGDSPEELRAAMIEDYGPVSATSLPHVASGHRAVPAGDSWREEKTGRPADLRSAESYPVTAECEACRGRIRLDVLLQMEWRHVPAREAHAND
jgi:hypothetical protein